MCCNLYKKVVSAVLALSLAVSMAACGIGTDGKTESSDSSETVSSIELTDQAGRKVILEEPAQTLVSCYYITTYATIALGVSDRVVGLEKKADSRQIYHLAAPQLLEQTQVGTLKEFNVEATAALDPDLVLMPAKLADYADTLGELGIAVLVVNPETQESMEEMLRLIAQACGVEEKAQALISYYDEQFENIKGLLGEAEVPTVYMGGNSSYLTTAPGAMYQSDLIARAGGENVAKNLEGDYWTEVSYETILTMNPDVIIIPCGAKYTAEDILNDAQMADIAAVKGGQVYQMPKGLEEWDSPIPSGILGVMWLTSVLHEDAYPFETFKRDASDYYRNFYGFEVDQAVITK